MYILIKVIYYVSIVILIGFAILTLKDRNVEYFDFEEEIMAEKQHKHYVKMTFIMLAVVMLFYFIMPVNEYLHYEFQIGELQDRLEEAGDKCVERLASAGDNVELKLQIEQDFMNEFGQFQAKLKHMKVPKKYRKVHEEIMNKYAQTAEELDYNLRGEITGNEYLKKKGKAIKEEHDMEEVKRTVDMIMEHTQFAR